MKRQIHFSTWAEIDLSAILENIKTVKQIIGKDVKLCYVVKADCYGYGLEQIIEVCKDETAIDMFGVASVEEGKKLRSLRVKKPIIVFRNPFEWEIEDYVKNDLILTLSDFEVIKASNKILSGRNKKLKIHIKIDTGLGRIGFLPEQIVDVAKALYDNNSLDICGAYSHFATSYNKDPENSERQLHRFLKAVDYLESVGIGIPIKHIASSSAAISYPESRLDMVRIGGAIYNRLDERFKPVFSLKSRVGLVKKIKKGTRLSYGFSYRAKQDEIILTIPAGHADGINPFLSKEVGEVLFRGKRCPIVGRISMDQLMVAVRGPFQKEIKKGEEVVIFGRQGNEEIKLKDVFSKLGHWNIIGGLKDG